ncbi:MAG TPA: DUF2298 domain-containing protein [Chloroflexota bacterium]|nr:DUF2298 domain-containing protein [Chloroflexota bacterium]
MIRAIPPLVGTLVLAAIVFVIAEPYAIIDFRRFVQGFTEQGDMVRGLADLPYTRQYFGRPPYLYFIQNLLLFGVGIPLGISMFIGLVYLLWRTIDHPGPGEILLLSYVLPYFAITGDFYAKFMRYLLPITPLLGLFAAFALIRLLDIVRSWRGEVNQAGECMPTVAPWQPALVPAVEVGGRTDVDDAYARASVSEMSMEEWDLDDLACLEGDLEVLATSEESSETLDWASSPVISAEEQAVGENGYHLVARLAGEGGKVSESNQEETPSSWEDAANGPLPSISAAKSASQIETTIDEESLRFAQLKGLSLDWFVEVDEPGPVRTPIDVARFVWSEFEDGDLVGVNSPPSWLERWPVLQRFLVGPWPVRFSRALIAIVLVFSVFYSLAYDNMLASPTTPVEGSLWLYQHAPRGATIATEHWEEGMPVPIVSPTGIDTADSHGFKIVTMPMYDDDNAAKLNTIVNNLEAADYVVFFSNRLYGTVPRIPARYPMSRRYYEDLFGEKLGFKLVAAFDRYPNLLGIAFVDDTTNDPGLPTPALLQRQRPAPITINLGHADESFSVYDHQKVLIFQKVQQLSPDQLRTLIGPPPQPSEVALTGVQNNNKSLLLTPAQKAIVETGGTFRDIFNRQDVFNQVPLLVWIILITLVGLAGVPLGFPVFRFLPDRGYLVSKTLGVLVGVWLIWIIVSLGIVQATRLATLAIFAVFLVAAAVLGHLQRDQIMTFVRERRGLILVEEAVFWLAFFSDVYIRSLDPDLWHPTLGGEKPMDLAYFTAAARSPIFPPYDPWFAGGYLNYYYFGQIIVGTLTKLSGVLPTTSYNLVVPMLFALTVGGVFSAAVALIHRGEGIPKRSTVAGGVLAGLMVCVIGNLAGFGQLAQQLISTSSISPNATPLIGPVIAFFVGAVDVITGARPLVIAPDWFWASTRVLNGTINEFPYFTFLFADLHAHLIGLPFTVLAIVFCINIVKSRGTLSFLPAVRPPEEGAVVGQPPVERTGFPWRLRWLDERLRQVSWSNVAATVLLGLTVGALFPINSWDYPTYLGLVALTLAMPWYLAARPTVRGLVTAMIRLVAVVILSRVLFLPFYASFQSFYSGVHPIPDKSDVSGYFAIHGLFLAIMVSYFVIEGYALYGRFGVVRSAILYARNWELLPRVVELQRALVRRWDRREIAILYGAGLVLLVAAACFALGMALTGILVVLLAVALAIGFHRHRDPEDCFVVFLFATGLALGIGTEQLAIDGDVGRMNTVFKFYEQVWVLWGIASAVVVIRYARRLLSLRDSFLRRLWATALVALFAMTLVYPVFGTISRVSDRFSTALAPTLDGTAYMNGAVYVDDGKALQLETDKEAIEWLQDNVDGTPTILEGNRPLYRWGSRFSIYTGLPTVIGWDWHQKQQRWGFQYEVDNRLQDVQQMYSGPSVSQTMALLHQYDVTYIIDGQLEQAFYPTAREKFDSMVGKTLKVVYDRDGVRIYQVIG